MPIYEYVCRKCDHTLDALQKMSDSPLVDCPECGAAELRRLISAPRFRLKGDGWYETDFKKDKQRNLLSSDGEAPKEKSAEERSSKEKSSEDKSADKAAKAEPAQKKDSGASAEAKPAKETGKQKSKTPAD